MAKTKIKLGGVVFPEEFIELNDHIIVVARGSRQLIPYSKIEDKQAPETGQLSAFQPVLFIESRNNCFAVFGDRVIQVFKGMIGLYEINSCGNPMTLDTFRWDTEEKGEVVCEKVKANSNYIFLFMFRTNILIALKIGEDKKLRKLWDTEVSFDSSEGYKSINSIDFLESKGVLLLGAGQNEIIA